MRVFWICDCAVPSWEVTLWSAEDIAGDLLEVLQLDRAGLTSAARALAEKGINQITVDNLARHLKVTRADIKAAFAEYDLTVRQLRTTARQLHTLEKTTASTPKKRPQTPRNVPSDPKQDRAVDELRTKFPKGCTASWRGEVEGMVVGYDAGPPLKVMLEFIDELGQVQRQPIPADLLDLVGQAF